MTMTAPPRAAKADVARSVPPPVSTLYLSMLAVTGCPQGELVQETMSSFRQTG
jgi:hypothetical protein